jgi:FkbM family methyltransferase
MRAVAKVKKAVETEDTGPLSRRDVIEAFKWILGRAPESEEVIDQHRRLESAERLRVGLVQSHEFASSNKFFRFGQKWVLVEVYGGSLQMWVDLHDLFVSYGCLADNYEPVETAFIKANTPAGGVALDIGANIGWHTLGMARAVGSEGKVVSFEPRQPTHRYLTRTVFQNRLDNRITLHPCGLWDRDDRLHLGWSENTINPGGSFVTSHRDGMVTQAIELKRLDDLVQGKVDFIKIDVEGAEGRVMAGAAKLLGTNKPLILAELNPSQLIKVSGMNAADFITQMAAFGYECWLLELGHQPRKITDFPVEIGRDLTNVVFAQPDHKLNWA